MRWEHWEAEDGNCENSEERAGRHKLEKNLICVKG